MRLRGDTRGEIGVFEDLQSLLVVVVAIAVLLSSILYNWSALSSTEEDQDLYDEAEHIVKQIEANHRLQAADNFASPYDEFLLSQYDLRIFVEQGGFEDEVRSDYDYNVTFDDLVVDEDHQFNYTTPQSRLSYTWMDEYAFGDPVPEGKDTVVLELKYTLVMSLKISENRYDVSHRHPCLVTVVVWR
jgi:hypothetical protein